MKKTTIAVGVALSLFLAATVGLAQQEKTKTFYLNLATRVMMPMKIPGMPDMGNIPGMPKPGQPTRAIDGTAVYPTKAVDPIFVTVPADLKLPGNKLVLQVPKPAAATTPDEGGDDTPDQQPQGKMEMTSKLYWHPETAKGPITDHVTVDMGKAAGPMGGMKMPNFNRLGMEDEGEEATGSEGKLPANVVGKGDYVLNTSGTAALTGFLPPLKVTEPADFGKVKPADGFTLTWEPVAGARGYIIHISGMNMEGMGTNTTKMTTTAWVSTQEEPPMRVRYGYRQATTIADDLRDGILLPGETTSCKVPPGMFDETINMLTVRVTAVGNDFYSTEGGVTVFGTIRSEWTTMLMLMDMGAMMGGGDEE